MGRKNGSGRYTKDMGQAAKEAADTVDEHDFWYPVMLLCEYDWNDAQDWAKNPEEIDQETTTDPCDSCNHSQIDEHHCERGAAPSFAKTLGSCAKQNVPFPE